MTPRILPLTPPHTPAVADQLAQWMPPDTGVEPIALFRLLTRSLPLTEALLPTGRRMLSRRSPISLRDRELVILRVCARLRCEYEWGVHVAGFAMAAGLTDEQVAATTESGLASVWTDDDCATLTFVDALLDGASVDDEAWAALGTRYDDDTLLELLVLVGWYHAIAFVANGVRLDLEEWAARFPAAAPA